MPHTKFTIEEGDGYTGISAPTEWYKGYKIWQWGGFVRAYDTRDGQKLVAEYYDYHNGIDGFTACKLHIDQKLPNPIPIGEPYRKEYEHWLKEPKVEKRLTNEERKKIESWVAWTFNFGKNKK